MAKAFRFGVVTGGRASRTEWVALARRIEELGYSTLLMPDVLGIPVATMTALTVAASVTTTLRVGSYVFVNDYRHPALLAREIATLDRLSDGRVELALGAGNWQHEYQQLGLSFDTPGVRVSRLAEAVSIIKQFFTGETVNYSGKYYTIAGLRPTPTPVQQPRPPIVIASSGRRMLSIAAREADVVLPVGWDEASLEERVGWVRVAAGERFERLELGKSAFDIELTDAPVAAGPATQGIQVEARPMTIEQAVAHLESQRARLGISYLQIQERQMENFAPVVARLNGK